MPIYVPLSKGSISTTKINIFGLNDHWGHVLPLSIVPLKELSLFMLKDVGLLYQLSEWHPGDCFDLHDMCIAYNCCCRKK